MTQLRCALSALLLLSAAPAAAEVMRCNLSESAGSGAVPSVLSFDIPETGTSAQAWDSNGGLLQARVLVRDAVKTELRWTAPTTVFAERASARDRVERTTGSAQFHATFLRGKGRVMLKVSPEGSARTFTGMGQCVATPRP